MASPETFGFEPDEDGNINFVTLETAYKIQHFQDYMDNWFPALVEVAENNPGFMPIATFDMPPPLPPLPEDDEEDET